MQAKQISDLKLSRADKRELAWTSAIYYYAAMFISLCLFLGGATTGAHGLLRAASPDMAANATCLPPPAPRVTSLAHISTAERTCRAEERDRQIRIGLFQGGQGIAMMIAGVIVFGWHFKRVRTLELALRKR